MMRWFSKEELLQECALADQKKESQLAHYRDMQAVYERQGRKMHDDKNQIRTMQVLLKEGDTQAVAGLAEKRYLLGDTSVKRMTVQADSMDEFLEKIRGIDWDSVKAENRPQRHIRLCLCGLRGCRGGSEREKGCNDYKSGGYWEMSANGIGAIGYPAWYGTMKAEKNAMSDTVGFMETMEEKVPKDKATDYDEKAFEMVGSNAPQDVRIRERK